MGRPLRAIFFDIDDTLYSTTAFTDMARDESVRAMVDTGINLPAETVRQELDRVVDNSPSNYGNHFDDLLKRLGSDNVTYQPDIIVAAGVVAHHKAKHRHLNIYEDALHVIRQLSQTTLILGIITAGRTTKQAEKIVRLGITPYIEPGAIFITELMGQNKEEPTLYQRACDTIGVSPKEAMVIGDNPLRDVDPSGSIGMITVLNRRSGKYSDVKGQREPDFTIHNFWDLDDILEANFEIMP